MNIQQSPLSLSLLGNMLHLVISSNADVTMTLSLGNEQLVAHTYSPDSAGMIDVDLRDIVSAHLTFNLQDAQAPYRQDGIVRTFSGTLTCGEQTEQFGFTVIRAGVDQLADTPSNFLAQNFLTWQPTVKPVTYYTPEFLTYYAEHACTVECIAYSSNGSGTSIRLGSLSAGGCNTIPTGYAVIAGRAGFLPSYYDVWIENQGGTRLTYIQRYYASDIKSEEEEWILFENSLGGIDTFRAYGDSENTSEHKHQVAEIEEESVEYRVDTERKHKKSTGLLDKYERRWLLDFFPSKGKYIYADQSIRRIVVTDSDVSYNVKELPSEYNFTYKFAEAKPYLNLPRTDATLQEMNIEVPDVGSFTIAPRLAEFPRQALSGGALFPVQNPYSESWGVTTLAAIAMYLTGDADFAASIVQNGLSENDVLEIVRGFVNGKFLSKVNDDEAAGEITFRKGLVSLMTAWFGNYLRSETDENDNPIPDSGAAITPEGTGDFLNLIVRGLVHGSLNVEDTVKSADIIFSNILKSQGARRGFEDGKGIFMDALQGLIQTEGLEVTGFMRVMELIINRLQLMESDYSFTEGDTVEHISYEDNGQTLVLTMKKDHDNDYTPFYPGDIIYGKVNDLLPKGAHVPDGHTITKNGSYYTTWMHVKSVDLSTNQLRVVLFEGQLANGTAIVPGGINFSPRGTAITTDISGSMLDEYTEVGAAGYDSMLTVTRRGNVADGIDPDTGLFSQSVLQSQKERQQSWVLSTTDKRLSFFWRVDEPIIRDDNYALCLGILPDLANLPQTRDPEMPSLYVNTIFYDNYHKANFPAKIIKEDRGEWSATPTAPYNGPSGTWSPDGTLSNSVLQALGGGNGNVTVTQGADISEPYHFAHVTRAMWMNHRLQAAYANLTDQELWDKMLIEWKTDRETSRVWHYGALWECLTDNTLEEPGLASLNWKIIWSPAISLAFFSTDNVPLQMLYIRNEAGINETVKPMVMFGQYDMSSTVRRWQWERESAFEDLDAAWANEPRAKQQIITLTGSDFPTGWENDKLSFKCTAWFGVGEDESEISNVINLF